MKKLFTRFAAVLLAVTICLQPAMSVSASTSSDAKNVKKMLTCFKQKKYKSAEKYARRLSSRTTDPSERKLSKSMKKKYRKTVENLMYKGTGSNTVNDVYFADLDGCGKPEMLVRYGSAESNMKTYIYKYRNNKSVRVGYTYDDHVQYANYPGHKGVIVFMRSMGYESISTLYLSKGKVVEKKYGKRYVPYDKEYLTLKQGLKSYIDYDGSIDF